MRHDINVKDTTTRNPNLYYALVQKGILLGSDFTRELEFYYKYEILIFLVKAKIILTMWITES